MNSGLDEKFACVAPAGTQFFYNTAVYAISKRILTAASKLSPDQLTRDWLTAPAAMTETAWRQRPAALADVGHKPGLVPTPRDPARFGRMILTGGGAGTGQRLLHAGCLTAVFGRSPDHTAT